MATKKKLDQMKKLLDAPVMPKQSYYQSKAQWWQQRDAMLNNIYGSNTYCGPFNK